MSYENEKNIASETETLSSEEQSVSRLLSNLKRVDAPGDFDFHLKARLANTSPDDYRPVRLFPILKYAMPLALFLFVAAAFVLTNSYSGWNVPAVVENSSPSDPSAIINTLPKTEVNSTSVGSTDNTMVAGSTQNVRRDFVLGQTKVPKLPRSNTPPSRDLRPGGSYDTTGNKARDPIPVLKSGQGSSNSTGNNNRPVSSRALEFRQVLRSIGINADQTDSGWAVRSLVKNGVAERSGLRIGDIMEAVDDKPIATLYDGSFSVKSISVRRGDNVVKIEIQNK